MSKGRSGPDFFPIDRWSIKSIFQKIDFSRFLEFSIFDQFVIEKSFFDFLNNNV